MEKFFSERVTDFLGPFGIYLLFIISRVLDVVTTEIALSKGFIEHKENIIFYMMENRYLSYIISSIILGVLVTVFLIYYIFSKRNYNHHETRLINRLFSRFAILLSSSSLLSVLFWGFVPLINNPLVILKVYPGFDYDFILIFVISPIFLGIYLIYGFICIYFNETAR